MSKKLAVLLIMLAMAFSFNVSVLAADTNIIYGEKSNTKVYDNPLTVDQIFTAFEMQPQRACLAYIVNYSFTSADMSSPFIFLPVESVSIMHILQQLMEQ